MPIFESGLLATYVLIKNVQGLINLARNFLNFEYFEFVFFLLSSLFFSTSEPEQSLQGMGLQKKEKHEKYIQKLFKRDQKINSVH